MTESRCLGTGCGPPVSSSITVPECTFVSSPSTNNSLQCSNINSSDNDNNDDNTAHVNSNCTSVNTLLHSDNFNSASHCSSAIYNNVICSVTSSQIDKTALQRPPFSRVSRQFSDQMSPTAVDVQVIAPVTSDAKFSCLCVKESHIKTDPAAHPTVHLSHSTTAAVTDQTSKQSKRHRKHRQHVRPALREAAQVTADQMRLSQPYNAQFYFQRYDRAVSEEQKWIVMEEKIAHHRTTMTIREYEKWQNEICGVFSSEDEQDSQALDRDNINQLQPQEQHETNQIKLSTNDLWEQSSDSVRADAVEVEEAEWFSDCSDYSQD